MIADTAAHHDCIALAQHHAADVRAEQAFCLLCDVQEYLAEVVALQHASRHPLQRLHFVQVLRCDALSFASVQSKHDALTQHLEVVRGSDGEAPSANHEADCT